MEPTLETGKVARRTVTRRTPKGGTAEYNRSRITNDKGLLPDNVDGRSVLARRFRDIAQAVIADQGGVDRCSEGRLQLIRRFAAVSCLAEQMEGDLIGGVIQVDIQKHALLCSTAVRLAQRIGLSRHAKAIVDNLFDSRGEPVEPYSPLRQSLARAQQKRAERAEQVIDDAEVIDP